MSKYSIKRAAFFLMVVTLIEKILGFGREMVIASQFGATGLTDSYIGGFLIPNFLMTLLNAGLVNVYAPVFLSESENNENEAWDKINSISTHIMIVLLVVTFIGIFFSKDIIKVMYSNFGESSLYAASSISRIFFIAVFIYSGAIIESALLNTFRHFIYPVISVGLLSAGMIAGVLIFGGKGNINSIAFGYLAGAVIGFILQLIKLKQIKGRIKLNLKLYPEFTAKFLNLLFPVLIATSMGQVNLFVDSIFASYLKEGSMSYISYAGKVTQLPILIFSGIVATIIFPDLIEYINKNDLKKLKEYTNRAIIITLIFLVPSLVGLDMLSTEITRLLFQRNAFDAAATVKTASTLIFLSPTIIMYGCIAVISKVYYSLKDNMTLMYISVITIILNALLDYVLMKPMAHNGIALSTSIVSVFQFLAAYIMLRKKVDLSMGSYTFRNLIKISLSSLGMAAVLYFIKIYLSISSLVLFVGLSIVLGAGVYFILLVILKVDGVELLTDKLLGNWKIIKP